MEYKNAKFGVCKECKQLAYGEYTKDIITKCNNFSYDKEKAGHLCYKYVHLPI